MDHERSNKQTFGQTTERFRFVPVEVLGWINLANCWIIDLQRDISKRDYTEKFVLFERKFDVIELRDVTRRRSQKKIVLRSQWIKVAKYKVAFITLLIFCVLEARSRGKKFKLLKRAVFFYGRRACTVYSTTKFIYFFIATGYLTGERVRTRWYRSGSSTDVSTCRFFVRWTEWTCIKCYFSTMTGKTEEPLVSELCAFLYFSRKKRGIRVINSSADVVRSVTSHDKTKTTWFFT